MKQLTILLAVTCLFAHGGANGFAERAEHKLSEHLQVFNPVVGKTFRGEFVGSTAERPKFDVSHWLRILNGQAIRIEHSMNDGEYGGETIITWDREQQKIVYWYFTTAGFTTRGTMEVNGKTWAANEKVVGNQDGVTEVRSASELFDDGRLVVKSEYLRAGKWVPGHQIEYRESPTSQVRFK